MPSVRSYLIAFGVVFFIGLLAAAGSVKAPEVYARLILPEWAPSSSLFGPVWTILYISIALSLGRFLSGTGWKGYPSIVRTFLFQLVLNASWSWLFFSEENILLATINILALVVFLLVLLGLLWRAGYILSSLLIFPYFCWVSFAAILTISIWRLNPAF